MPEFNWHQQYGQQNNGHEQNNTHGENLSGSSEQLDPLRNWRCFEDQTASCTRAGALLFNVTERRPVEGQWPSHRVLLNYARGVYGADTSAYEGFAGSVCAVEKSRVRKAVDSISLETPQGRAQQWQTIGAYTAYARNTYGQNAEIWVSELCMDVRNRTLNFTANKPFVEQWAIHREFLTYVDIYVPGPRSQGTSERYDQAANVHSTERHRVIDYARNLNEATRWQWYTSFLTHVRGISPEYVQFNLDSIYSSEYASIPPNGDIYGNTRAQCMASLDYNFNQARVALG